MNKLLIFVFFSNISKFEIFRTDFKGHVLHVCCAVVPHVSSFKNSVKCYTSVCVRFEQTL
jgi:hypothetical protein